MHLRVQERVWKSVCDLARLHEWVYGVLVSVMVLKLLHVCICVCC